MNRGSECGRYVKNAIEVAGLQYFAVPRTDAVAHEPIEPLHATGLRHFGNHCCARGPPSRAGVRMPEEPHHGPGGGLFLGDRWPWRAVCVSGKSFPRLPGFWCLVPGRRFAVGCGARILPRMFPRLWGVPDLFLGRGFRGRGEMSPRERARLRLVLHWLRDRSRVCVRLAPRDREGERELCLFGLICDNTVATMVETNRGWRVGSCDSDWPLSPSCARLVGIATASRISASSSSSRGETCRDIRELVGWGCLRPCLPGVR